MLDLPTQIEPLRQDMNKLRGQIEVLGNNIDGTAKRQRDMYVDLDTRLRRLEQPGAPAQRRRPCLRLPARHRPRLRRRLAAAAPGKPAAPATAAAAPADAAETRIYEAAQSQRRIGNYQGAIAAFQNFIRQYPKSTLAPRAQYWIGDSYFNLRDFKNAIASQQKLIKTYPDSPSVPDALLNIASSQIGAGRHQRRQKNHGGLVARYPLSDAAEKAKRRLAANECTETAGPPRRTPAGQRLHRPASAVYRDHRNRTTPHADRRCRRVARCRDAARHRNFLIRCRAKPAACGLPTVFVRLTGCPLRCGYCDTAYAFHGGELADARRNSSPRSPRYRHALRDGHRRRAAGAETTARRC